MDRHWGTKTKHDLALSAWCRRKESSEPAGGRDRQEEGREESLELLGSQLPNNNSRFFFLVLKWRIESHMSHFPWWETWDVVPLHGPVIPAAIPTG